MKKKKYQQPTATAVGLPQQTVLTGNGSKGVAIEAKRNSYNKQSEQTWD